MVFCNKKEKGGENIEQYHNPYFSRWFSAILEKITIEEYGCDVTILILVDGFLQSLMCKIKILIFKVTILILVDGFLQSTAHISIIDEAKSQSLF